MEKKVYNLMNWPEIEGIVYSESDRPQELLGAHMCAGGMLIQVFRPDAVEILVGVEGKQKKYAMEKVDEAGYFAALIPIRKIVPYTLQVEDIKGKKEIQSDPYAYPAQLTAAFRKKFLSGGCFDIYKYLGAHKKTINGVTGVYFATWAPDAMRVSVVGDFNNWDGRRLQMMKDEETGIFEIFVPGLSEDVQYKYEIKAKGARLLLKSDPYALSYDRDNNYASSAAELPAYKWEDDDWINSRDRKSISEDRMSVCELSLEDYKNAAIASETAARISEMGFTHVELMTVCEYVNSNTDGYETLGYFAPTGRIGGAGKDSRQEFMSIVQEFHKNGIGVIMDWNAAFMGKAAVGMTKYDGTNLYEVGDARLDKHPELDAATFDYKKPQVKQLLIASALLWAEKYHVDGLRIDETASMLYLDYGKNPGEWCPNIYGENGNLEAIDMLHQLRAVLDKKCPNTLLIAEESSGWPKVTGSVKNECLGFDFKWNYGWKNDFISFMEKDPLFRKGEYGKLTYSMLYNYSENYMLTYSHEEFSSKNGNMYDKLPGMKKEDRMADMRLMYAYMYMHPGKKLVNYGQLEEVSGFIKVLNEFYGNNKALYQLDYKPEGFEWIDNLSADETVMSFVRRDADNDELLVVVNFTPVVRENYRVGVTEAGRYREEFNSDSIQFGGAGNVNRDICKSDSMEWDGRDDSIAITLPPLGIAVFSHKPYSEVELEEMRIIEEASKAKKKAEEEASRAEELKVQAEAEARAALEAEEKAKEAAAAALKAKEEAERQALEAERQSLRIDAQMKKKLEMLEKLKEIN